MRFTVNDLIEGRQKPVTVQPHESVKKTLQLMNEYDFSQLPVVDDDYKPLGIITSDSILHALTAFEITVNSLRVADAMVKADESRGDEDLFDLLDDLAESGAVLIVDGERHLTGIVTNYDTASYFRRRAEDIMLVEDIENTLKDFILAPFTDASGEIDQAGLEAAIQEITPSNQKLLGRFQQAISYYLEKNNESNSQIKKEWMEEAFSKHLYQKEPPKPFDKLTLYDYVELFLHKNRWPHYSATINLDPKAVRKLLEAVRNTRNDLAHFRVEISPQQRSDLRFCKQWLYRYQPTILASVSSSSNRLEKSNQIENNIGNVTHPSPVFVDEQELTSEEPSTSNSRYAPLGIYLKDLPDSQDKEELKFKEIEAIIQDQLPKSAREHRTWWANNSVSRNHSQQWLDAGWRVGGVGMNDERVIFVRVREREKAFINFFSALVNELGKVATFQLKDTSPAGQRDFRAVDLVEKGVHYGYLSFYFAENRRFRVELYIDTLNHEKNKMLFDSLYMRKEEIETAFGASISWERIENKRASRIAVYHEGSIMDSPEELLELRKWAIKTFIRFYSVIIPHFVEVVAIVEQSAQV